MLDEMYRVWDAFVAYSTTSGYLEGLFVEVSGMLIDILLLAVIIPIVIWLYGFPQKWRSQSSASFLSLQFIRECVVFVLKTGGVSSVDEVVNYEISKGRLDEKFSHSVYGNTENLLTVLKHRMRRGSHVLGHRSLERNDIDELRKESHRILAKCEQYIILFSSLKLHGYSEKFYRIQLILIAFKDYFERMNVLVGRSSFPIDDFRGYSSESASALDSWFEIERARPDGVHAWRMRMLFVSIIFSLPWVMLQRFVVAPLVKLSGKKYRDPYRMEILERLFDTAENKWGKAEVLKILGVTESQLRKVLRQPSSSSELVGIWCKLRSIFDAKEWDFELKNAIVGEIRRVRKNALMYDAIVANAMFVFVQYSVESDEEFSMRLMFWFNTYDGVFEKNRKDDF